MVDTGSTHDSQVLNESDLYQRQELFFEDATAYLLGDSAYRLTNRVIKPYSKRLIEADQTGELAAFNIHFSSARVKVEHAYGFVKGRFPIMKELPIVAGSTEGNKEAVKIIFTICILHNFLLSLQDNWDLDAEQMADSDREMMRAYHSIQRSQWCAELERTRGNTSTANQMRLGALKREWLTEYIITWLLEHHRIQ